MTETMPEGFPPNTLAPQRAFAALAQQNYSKLASATEALWEEFWVKGNIKTSQPEVFVPILERVLGPSETKAVLEAVGTAFPSSTHHKLIKSGKRARHQGTLECQYTAGL